MGMSRLTPDTDLLCKECGAAVTNTDRFCPACGTPNLDCKFHPKFGPGITVFEPRVISDLAPPGSPSCPRCHRLMVPEQEYCSGCGMELAAAWERYEQVTVLNAWRQRRGPNARDFKDLRWFSVPLQTVLVVGIVLASVVGVVNLWLYARGAGLLSEGPANADMWRALDLTTTVAIGLFAAGGLLTIGWTMRAYRNLPALAVGDLRYGTSWALLGWITPGFNFIRPKQVVDDIWRGSHPQAPPFSSSWRLSPIPVWSALWWTGAWLGGAMALASHLTNPVAGLANSSDRQSSLLLAGAAGLLLAGSAMCLQLLVSRIGERQEMRAAVVFSLLDLDLDDETADDADDPTAGLEDTKLLRRTAEMDAVFGRY